MTDAEIRLLLCDLVEILVPPLPNDGQREAFAESLRRVRNSDSAHEPDLYALGEKFNHRMPVSRLIDALSDLWLLGDPARCDSGKGDCVPADHLSWAMTAIMDVTGWRAGRPRCEPPGAPLSAPAHGGDPSAWGPLADALEEAGVELPSRQGAIP
jgi:hypothetical protein